MSPPTQAWLLAVALNALHCSANPFPIPPPANGSIAACTTYLTTTFNGFHGGWAPRIERTVYTDTVTESHYVPCGGCALSITTDRGIFWGGIGPVEIVTGTTTASTPSTTTTTVCETGHRGMPPPLPATPSPVVHRVRTGLAPSPNAGNATECTFTKTMPLTPLKGGTLTVWPSEATITSHIDCRGCKHVHVSSVNGYNPGPAVHFTETTTASVPLNKTVFMCLKTPSRAGSAPTVTPQPLRIKRQENPSASLDLSISSDLPSPDAASPTPSILPSPSSFDLLSDTGTGSSSLPTVTVTMTKRQIAWAATVTAVTSLQCTVHVEPTGGVAAKRFMAEDHQIEDLFSSAASASLGRTVTTTEFITMVVTVSKTTTFLSQTCTELTTVTNSVIHVTGVQGNFHTEGSAPATTMA